MHPKAIYNGVEQCKMVDRTPNPRQITHCGSVKEEARRQTEKETGIGG